ncbi:MAG: L-threonylcarbamoyladenylate synthase [Candidatus Kapaibacterium sp.]
MAYTYSLHARTPDAAILTRIAEHVRAGAVILYPTDTGMALGCALRNKAGIERIRSIRNIPARHSMTFLCDSMAHIAEYALVSDRAFHVMKKLVPGPFTFILPATKRVPVFAHDPKRTSVGIRIPGSAIARNLLRSMEEPLVSVSAKNGEGEEYGSWQDCVDDLGRTVDLVIDIDTVSDASESLGFERSTIVDMRSHDFVILRHGARSEDVEELLEPMV